MATKKEDVFNLEFFKQLAITNGKKLRVIDTYKKGHRELRLIDIGLYHMVCIFSTLDKSDKILHMSVPITSRLEGYMIFNKRKKLLLLGPYPMLTLAQILVVLCGVTVLVVFFLINYV